MHNKVGDIFEFSINENSTSYGQIIKVLDDSTLVVIVFESQYKNRPSICELLEDRVLLYGITLDAKLYNKDWKIIASETRNLSTIKSPYFKIGTSPVFIENIDKQIIREATEKEIERLVYRTIVAPVRFELALKGYYKQIEWKDKYDSLLYSKIEDSIRIVEGNHL